MRLEMYYICKNSIPLLRKSCRNFIYFKTIVPFSTTVSVIQNPLPHNPLIVDYLINSYGFSRDKAVSASSRFSPKTSPSNFDSVLEVLKQSGFSNTQIKNLISKRPAFLSIKVEKTLKPKLKILEDLGFSGLSLTELILKNPSVLTCNVDKLLTPNVHFLRSLLHTDENIVRFLKRSGWILTFDLRKLIACKIAILHRCGVPDKRIFQFLLQRPKFFSLKLERIEDAVSWVVKSGVNLDSGLFIRAVYTISDLSRATLAVKFDLYKSYGWSDSDIISVFRRAPNFLLLSEQNVRASMGFLLDELRFEPKDIILSPLLLMFSLEKRLKPWSEVLKILNSKRLVVKKKAHLRTVMYLPEKKFLENYVIRYVDKAPEIQEVYMDTRGLSGYKE